ncbi:carboxylesterase family protein [Ottowia thiooxydans]|uniref:carboxylesterase family protein n=1 Tax=Ottowia thiooxydans TaxID=219182 RepID=UPI00040C4A32|nr:carboxylesterase family protein [Ottowia thiooxydans]
MEIDNNQPVVRLQAGKARGQLREGVAVFRGLPYGQRVDTASRLSDLKAPDAWQGELDATQLAAVFPQSRSRLALVMGDGIKDNPQSEDAFVVNVWAPENAKSLPVLFFIHGGAFVSGGGSAPWYDGERLAREEAVVVVTVNYRLGALGHLGTQPDIQGANRPVRDLLQALRWVQENIAAFGGNADQVTVGGQSAGAWYAWLLGMSPASKGLLRRNILMSLPKLPPMSQEEVHELRRSFGDFAGGLSIDSSLTVEQVLAAQMKVMQSAAAFGDVSASFRPAYEESVVPEWMFDITEAARNSHVSETLLGSTAEENASFFFRSEEVLSATEQRVRQWFEQSFGADADAVYDRCAKKRPGHTPYTQLVDAGSELMFGRIVPEIAQALTLNERSAYAYSFNVASGLPHLMSPHCMELPFLFGNRKDWSDAPMLTGVSEQVFEHVGGQIRRAIGGFVREGVPRDSSGAAWPRWDEQQRILTEMIASGVRRLPFVE